MAVLKHEQRRRLVVADANTIGDLYGCASLLNEPIRTRFKPLYTITQSFALTRRGIRCTRLPRIQGKNNHPVVQVACRDARAYCKSPGGRRPTEAEYGFAQRRGLEEKRYSRGVNSDQPQGTRRIHFKAISPPMTTWNDEPARTSPVGAFPANGYGLYDITGNVWEWTSDWYRSDYVQLLANARGILHNPHGPATSFDATEPGMTKRVRPIVRPFEMCRLGQVHHYTTSLSSSCLIASLEP